MTAGPRLLPDEWHAIQRVLPSLPPTGRPRQGDREAIAALLFAEALKRPLQQVAPRRVAATMIIKRSRWRGAGVWDAILVAGAPAMRRMYREHLRDPQNR